MIEGAFTTREAAIGFMVYVHPFSDGNGRLARALSYMMLLQAGYDFFRYFSISGIVAKERGIYYRSMVNVENSDCDMTYFIDYYSDMLSRTAQQMEDHLIYHVLAISGKGEDTPCITDTCACPLRSTKSPLLPWGWLSY